MFYGTACCLIDREPALTCCADAGRRLNVWEAPQLGEAACSAKWEALPWEPDAWAHLVALLGLNLPDL